MAEGAHVMQKTGYQGFGSFHSEDVEVLIRQPDAEYSPPPLPFPDPTEGLTAPTELGAAVRHLWLIDFARWTFINHGAFGGVAAPVQAAADAWRRHAESQPLAFIDRQLFPHMVRVFRELAAFLHCQPQDLALLPNATTGLNTIIRSVRLAAGDTLFMLDIGYGSVKKMLAVAAQEAGAAVVTAEVPLPISGPDDVVAAVAAALPATGCRLAVFDAVTSNTALVLPLPQLIELCRARGIPVLVDGAHALGQLPVDLQQLRPDFWVSNCHKWLCGARGSAVMWVAPERRAGVRPLVLSHGSGAGFTSDFIWDGCRDYAPALAVSTALRFHRLLGPERLRAHGRQLLAQAAELLVGAWGTGLLAPLAMCACMALVRLPEGAAAAAASASAGAAGTSKAASPAAGSPAAAAAPAAAASSADAKLVQDALHYLAGVEVPVKCLAGGLYVRISAAPYNQPADYQALADVVAGWMAAAAAGAAPSPARAAAG